MCHPCHLCDVRPVVLDSVVQEDRQNNTQIHCGGCPLKEITITVAPQGFVLPSKGRLSLCPMFQAGLLGAVLLHQPPHLTHYKSPHLGQDERRKGRCPHLLPRLRLAVIHLTVIFTYFIQLIDGRGFGRAENGVEAFPGFLTTKLAAVHLLLTQITRNDVYVRPVFLHNLALAFTQVVRITEIVHACHQ